jgi:hypothetical protein
MRTDNKFYLDDLRSVEYGEHFTLADVNYANELLRDGKSRAFVWGCIHSWAAGYEYEANCETKEAAQFEEWSYGYE